MIIDSHFHSNEMQAKGMDPEAILASAFSKAELGIAVDICTSTEQIAPSLKLAANLPSLWLAAGIYPSECDAADLDRKLSDLETQLLRFRKIQAGPKQTQRIIALGEIGLDYHWNYGTPDLQKNLFSAQIALANKLELPIIVHCREAQLDMLHCLQESPVKRAGIIHCFSGNVDFARACIELGFRLSFAGNVTYTSATQLQEVLKNIPLSALLLETDSPYLSPRSKRGALNTPSNVGETYAFAAELLGISRGNLEDQIKENFLSLFPECREAV